MMDEIITKKCPKCGETKPLSEYYAKRKGKNPRQSRCKICQRKEACASAKKHPERVRAAEKRFREAHPERDSINGRKHYLAHREERLEKAKIYYREHSKERLAYRNEYSRKHPEKEQEYDHNRRARKLFGGGTVSEEEWIGVLEKFGHKCLCCGKTNIKLTMDHVVPLALGGLHTVENLQPLCRSCNCTKNARTIDYRPNNEEANEIQAEEKRIQDARVASQG